MAQQPAPRRGSEPKLDRFPMLDEIRLHETGHVLEASRTFSLEEDRFLRDHVYEGTALVPGVMGLETMAEAAAFLFPELRFIGAEKVEFLRSLKLHRGQPAACIVRATAEVNGVPEGQRRVETLLLSRRTTATGRTIETVHFRALIRLGPRFATEPEPIRFELPGSFHEGPGRDTIYERMFHTGLFRVLERVPYLSAEATVAYGVQPDGELTRKGGNDDLVSDPMPREMAFQAGGLLGMSLHSRSYLPVGIDRVWQFGRAEPGQRVVLRVALRNAPEDRITMDAEVRSERGALLQRLEGLSLIGHSPLLPEQQLPAGAPFRIRRQSLNVLSLDAELGRIGSSGEELLTFEERAEWRRFRRQQRRDEWMAARLAAKTIVRDFLRDLQGRAMPLRQIEIAHRASGEPYARLVPGEKALPEPSMKLPPLSLTHSQGIAIVVLSAPEFGLRPGVDLERVEARSHGFTSSYFREDELELPGLAGMRPEERVTSLWALKEAVSKSLGMGLRASTFEIVVRSLDTDGWAEIELSGEARREFELLDGSCLKARVYLALGFAFAESYLLCGRVEGHGPGPHHCEEVLTREELSAVAALLHHKGLL